MKGSTNASSKGTKAGVEKINLTLRTNQSSHEDLIGVSFSIRYGTYSKDYVWEGEAMTVEVPEHVTYTVSFGEKEDYKAPDSLSYTAVPGNARTVNATYLTEVVTVNVSANDGASMAGQTVTINGTEHTFDGIPVVQKVAFGTDYEVSVSDNGDYETPQPQSFTAQLTSRTVNMQYIDSTDLSKVDIYGNSIAQNTANCYVIKETGKYKFPIAYGAAVKNGAANTEAYTNNGGANSHDFVNYLGNVISSPYVETDTAKQAASVQISIADTENAVTDLQIVDGDDCRYVKFTVPSLPPTGANAVISVKDSDGIIMWSWHIWLWSDDLSVVEITNATNVKYKILPVNLGSKWDEDTKEHIKNWFYQFGRPTPLLCPSAYNATTDHASYGVLSYAAASIASAINLGIQNPTTLYESNSTYYHNWFKSNSAATFNLWDAACAVAGNSDNNVVKTIYDPCPVGFKMPNGNTFTFFSTSNVIGSFANGWKFKRYSDDTVGIFFPASGFRTSNEGLLDHVGSRGSSWLSSSNDLSFAYRLYFTSNNVSPRQNNYRAYGFSVRPVQDEDSVLLKHKLTISISGDTQAPSGYEINVCRVVESIDETTGEVTETLGDVLATQTTASATHELTWGTKYKIVCGDAEGFAAPADSQTFVADVEYRTYDAVYVYDPGLTTPTNGVWIQSVDGKYYSEDNWDGSKVADCVAVVTSSCRFGIALTEASSKMTIHSDASGELEDYMTAISDETQAKADYNGANNTANIMKLQSGTGYAAGWCNAYTFPSGKKGFLPSLGQMWAAYNNKAAVDAAITKAGGTALTSTYYWTSTYFSVYFSGQRTCWVLLWSNGYVVSHSLSYNFHVRAFKSL